MDLSGTQAGQIIATAVFIPIAAMGDDFLLSWGWRIPFWSSVVVILAGVVIRRTLQEPPAFDEEADEEGKVHASPVAEVFRTNWQGVLRVTLGACANTIPTIFGVWALTYATKTQGIASTDMLWVSVLGNVVALGAIPFWATVADRFGRRPVFVGGAIGSAILMFFYLQAIETKNMTLVFVVGIVMMGVVYSALNGVWPAFYGEMFSTRTRITGMAIGTQIGFAIGGFAPTIAETLAHGEGRAHWLPVWFLVAGAVVLVCLAALSAKETAPLTLREIDASRG